MLAAPASTNSVMNVCADARALRCTSSGIFVCALIVFTAMAGPKVDVRHEMAVHHVDVQQVGVRLINARGSLGTEVTEVGGDDRREQ